MGAVTTTTYIYKSLFPQRTRPPKEIKPFLPREIYAKLSNLREEDKSKQ
jgi:hypothetical protein